MASGATAGKPRTEQLRFRHRAGALRWACFQCLPTGNRSMFARLDLRRRALAAGIHLLISAAIAALAAFLVFGLWYPGAFRLMAGGRDLFFLVTSVDVVLGPLLTFAVFNVAKGRKHLRRDLAVIGAIQTAALLYGLHTVFVVRPVAMVFEVDRFRLITASNVYLPELERAPPEYQALPLTGPLLLGSRRPQPGSEHNDALFMGLNGVDVGQRPLFWQSYERSAADALARSRPLSVLLQHDPGKAKELSERLAELRADPASGRFLPTLARGEWTAVLDPTGKVLGYLPVDGFF